MLVFLLGTIILMWRAYLLASLIINGKRVGLISSAAGRLRWRWMLMCGLVAAVLSAVGVAPEQTALVVGFVFGLVRGGLARRAAGWAPQRSGPARRAAGR